MRSLLYIYDPLCGWCYAATKSIACLRQAGVDITLLPSGLFAEPGRRVTSEFAAYAWQNDQRIAALTGQAFSAAYRRQVLEAVGTAFDSSAATLALSAVALTVPAHEADALRLLQEGRYVTGLDITDIGTVRGILAENGLRSAADALESPADALLSANAARIASGRSTLRELGAAGVPTLVLEDGTSRRLMDSNLLYGPPGALLARFEEPTIVGVQQRISNVEGSYAP